MSSSHGRRDDYHKPHAVCIPFPVQSHINGMLCLAKLLHQRGFFITFVNTEYNHRRIIKTRGPDSLDGLPDFQFRTIPDGLPEASDVDAPQDMPSLCVSISKNFLAPFCSLLSQIKDDAASSSPTSSIPQISSVVADGCMSFSIPAAAQIGVPVAHLWPINACSFLGFMYFQELVDRGITPLPDESYLTNGYLDTVIDWIPGMKNIRLKDLPSYIRTTDRDDILLNTLLRETGRTRNSSAIILNTFDAIDRESLDALSSLLPPIYTIGPLHILARLIEDESVKAIATNLWEEESKCIDWLNSKEPNSVIYVNFGSLTVMEPQQLIEFAWGIANSEKSFLWIIRPDLVQGDSAILPFDFLEKTKERGMIASWCSQEEVLKHRGIGGFLTHCGWNSALESICAGVPIISWPFGGDQITNSRYCCVEWGIGLEIDSNVKRDEVERCIRELMDGKKGEDMKRKAMELKSKADESYKPGGSSYENINKLIVEILLRNY